MNAVKTKSEIRFCDLRIEVHRPIGIRCEVRSAEVVFGGVTQIGVPIPEHRLFLFHDILCGFEFGRNGQIRAGVVGCLRSRNFDQGRTMPRRWNLDDGVDPLGIGR